MFRIVNKQGRFSNIALSDRYRVSRLSFDQQFTVLLSFFTDKGKEAVLQMLLSVLMFSTSAHNITSKLKIKCENQRSFNFDFKSCDKSS